MDDESTNIRLTHIEANFLDLKASDKELFKSVGEIEKSNIRTEESLKKILATYELIKSTTVGLLVVNVIGILLAMWAKQ